MQLSNSRVGSRDKHDNIVFELVGRVNGEHSRGRQIGGHAWRDRLIDEVEWQ